MKSPHYEQVALLEHAPLPVKYGELPCSTMYFICREKRRASPLNLSEPLSHRRGLLRHTSWPSRPEAPGRYDSKAARVRRPSGSPGSRQHQGPMPPIRHGDVSCVLGISQTCCPTAGPRRDRGCSTLSIKEPSDESVPGLAAASPRIRLKGRLIGGMLALVPVREADCQPASSRRHRQDVCVPVPHPVRNHQGWRASRRAMHLGSERARAQRRGPQRMHSSRCEYEPRARSKSASAGSAYRSPISTGSLFPGNRVTVSTATTFDSNTLASLLWRNGKGTVPHWFTHL
jgi:hypothetical protein